MIILLSNDFRSFASQRKLAATSHNRPHPCLPLGHSHHVHSGAFLPQSSPRGIDQATPIMCIQVPNHHQGGLIRVAFQMALLQLFSLESQGLPTYRSQQIIISSDSTFNVDMQRHS